MFAGVATGLAFPVGPVGALPQMSRAARFGEPLPTVDFEPALGSALAAGLAAGLGAGVVLPPVLLEEADPVGFSAVGTTAGTEVQALS